MAKNLESVEHKERNQIVHIRGDSDSELQALFDSVLKPDAHRPLQLPLRLRNLPDSFFKPPPTGSKSPSVASGSHSRENSADLTPFNGTPPALGPIHHSRAHSSPASLQQTMQVGQQRVVQHTKQQSCDLSIEHLPLPEGWEQAKTPQGQIYFLNHLTQTTTWEDPRKKMLQIQPQTPVASTTPTMIAPPVHGAATTPAAGSSAAAMLAASQQALNQALGPLPDGWEQAVTPEGELYYIDHHTRKTSWFDPRLPVHMQKPPMVHGSGGQALSTLQQQQQHLHQQLQSLNTGSTPSSAASHSSQQQVRLQRLQLEQDRLRQRQQEIIAMMERETRMRQQESNIVSQSSSDFNLRRIAAQNTVPNMASDSESVDPFLSATAMPSTTPTNHHCAAAGSVNANIESPSGPAVLATDFHARQESADSGLGMGSNYSLPHTPEDFLAMDDTMDTSLDCKMLGPSSVATVDMNDITPSLEVGNLPSNMDTTDELVPTLDIGEDLSSDILNEVLLNSNKVDNVLTWL